MCEDTRHSKVLLKHYEIFKPLVSFHKFNENSRENEVISDLKKGKQISLISDAGTPGISDPGNSLIKRCQEENLPITAIPGPCAAIQAISTSSFSTNRFQFLGFLPKKKTVLEELFKNDILVYPGTTICYESPFRIKATLEILASIAPIRRVSVARELTKKFEEQRIGTCQDLAKYFKENPPKGEIVLLIEGGTTQLETINENSFSKLSISSHVDLIMTSSHLSKNEAIKYVAQMRHLPKSVVYKAVHHDE